MFFMYFICCNIEYQHIKNIESSHGNTVIELFEYCTFHNKVYLISYSLFLNECYCLFSFIILFSRTHVILSKTQKVQHN